MLIISIYIQKIRQFQFKNLVFAYIISLNVTFEMILVKLNGVDDSKHLLVGEMNGIVFSTSDVSQTTTAQLI